MSNARELALLEKWADKAAQAKNTTTTITPPISPTSPKATKFCCCPNRRRYNVKQPKKSTLDARNIFIDNDFTYIDDVSNATTTTSAQNSSTKSSKSSKSNAAPTLYRNRTRVGGNAGNGRTSRRIPILAKQATYSKSNYNEYDDISDIVGNNNNNHDSNSRNCTAYLLENEKTEQQAEKEQFELELEESETEFDGGKQWRHDESGSCHNNTNNNEQQQQRNSCSNCLKQTATTPATTTTTMRTALIPEQQQQEQQLENLNSKIVKSIQNDNNVVVTKAAQSGNDSINAVVIKTIKYQEAQAASKRTEPYNNNNVCDNDKSVSGGGDTIKAGVVKSGDDDDKNEYQSNKCSDQQQTIQRHSNSLFKNKFNNNNNNINNSSNSNSNTNSNHRSKSQLWNGNSNRNSSSVSSSNSDTTNTLLNNGDAQAVQNNSCSNINNNNKVKTDLKKKMTITTTTNVAANRKRNIGAGECGLTTATNGTAMTPTTPTAAETTTAAIPTTASPSTSPTPSTTGMATATTMATRPTTPSLTTVIKTTMVKRSPSNEAKSPTTTTAPATIPTVATISNYKANFENFILHTNNSNNINTNSNNNDNNNKCDESTNEQPTRTVKERIAALVAGNEQMRRNHDNSIKTRSQCNKTQTNMTTVITTTPATPTTPTTPTTPPIIQAKCAINSLHHNQAAANSSTANVILINNKCPTTINNAAMPVTSALVHNNDSNTALKATAKIPSRQLSLDASMPQLKRASLSAATAAAVAAATKPTLLLADNRSATMPRRRSPAMSAAAVNERSNCSSTAGAAIMTTDKKFLNADKNCYGTGANSMAGTSANATSRQLAALDNLDLALNLDLTDVDSEDPYNALQEYLEKVKHEINEVFELHKARQRMQQQQQQGSTAASTVATLAPTSVAAPNDELSRSTESDSGFDSASGGHIGSSNNNNTNNKLHSKSTEIAAATATVTANKEEMQRLTEVGCSSNDFTDLPNAALTKELATVVKLKPITTNLKALPPPPISPTNEKSTHNTETALILKQQHAVSAGAMEAIVAETTANTNAACNEDVNIWANKFLRDLDNLMASDKPTTSAASSPTSKTSPMLLSAAATAAIQSRYGKNAIDREHYNNTAALSTATNGVLLRPEKHATIPLQSFNLDCGHVDNAGTAAVAATATTTTTPSRANIVYMRTLSAPTPYQQQQLQQQIDSKTACCIASGKSNRNSLAAFNVATFAEHQHQQQQQNNLINIQCNNDAAATNAPMTATTTILKIEETAAALAAAAKATSGQKQQRTSVATRLADSHDAEKEATATASVAAALKNRRHCQMENDMETIRNATALEVNSNNSSDKNMLVASAMATSIPKRERINHATMTKPTTASAFTTSNFISAPTTLLTSSKTNNANASASAGGTTTTTTIAPTTYLLNGNDATKKGSTSTIWTSEESILRSVGAVDEDNNSTSSSACEEASGVLSSGKSGISLDSSGLDNDNNESGIGTATPPKDMSYWKSMHNDNESISSLDALRKMKFQKSSSVASSDDPDLLEVLSLCDEPHHHGDDVCEAEAEVEVDMHESQQQQQEQQMQKHQQQQQQRQSRHRQRRQQQHHDNDDSKLAVTVCAHDDEVEIDVDADEDDEGHDEFETVPYCDCEYTDGDASSASGGGSVASGSSSANVNNKRSIGSLACATANETNGVVLRRKYTASPIMVPYSNTGAAQKCRSHSLDTSSLPSSYYHLHHQHPQQHHPLTRKLHQPHAHHHHNHNHHHHHHHHLQNRTKERAQLSLALRQEPFQSLLAPTHFHELPSPSSASLHSGHESLDIQELTTKSNSAPLLLKQEKKRDDFAGQKLTLRYSRSQSDRYLAEIEAVEACKWLRAAGFPQYAQMYEDHQFPIDLTNVAKDHTNLENDQLQSLYRRLCILNRCANMRLDQSHKAQTPQKEDSDDENFALSENWTFQPHIRRWSRIGEMGLEIPSANKLNIEKTESSSKESSPDRFEDDSYDLSGAGLSLTLPGACADDSTDTTLNDAAADTSGVRLRRTGSERLKDGAKAFLRHVESIKSRRRKRQNREGIVISGPQALDLSQLGQRSSMRKPDAVYSTPPSPSAVSPMHTFPKSPFFSNELKVPSQSEKFLSPNRSSPKRTPTTPRSMRTSPLHFFSNPMPHLKEGKSDDSSSYYSDSQESSTGGKLSLRKTPSKTRRFLQRTGKVDDIGAHSDSECHHGRKLLIKDANSNTTEVKVKKLTRGGSLNLGKDPKKREGFRTASFRSRSTTRKETKSDDVEHVKKAPVVRWHSFQMEERPHMIFRKCFSQKIDPNANEHGIPFAAMSAGQLQIIRKLALVILTGYMERYCPSHRSGWNWELPKFIKKIKMPDYKDKKVFGVPLLLILQRTGQTLPISVRAAFRWLQLNALDQIGLFRKSGVKSRIIKLKELIEYSESAAECMDVFDTQQAYDVADMLKQYFRDLPESLLTTKMSETFAAIFQHLPPEVRLDAVQCAVLLLPDENREILFALLEFLTLVAVNSQYNQMTANNLAVCLAPSLFHSSISTGTASVAASPRRRGKGSGVPDAKELTEAKASHECLAFMIDNYKQIFTASKEKISKCNFGYMEESKPVPLEALGEGMQFHNWRGYLYECTSATIKEGREKTRGWFNITSQIDNSVEISYKKVGDGHPLRLWRCATEVEGPPKDVLEYIIKQRASWDPNLMQSQTVKKLDERTEIFQYALDGQISTDFCVLRSWQTDLPRGACVIVETSIDHSKAKPIFGSVRGVVLASRYLIEPCGGGRSRVMHLARVDIKGRTPEWYNKSYGHICSHYLARIRLAFKHVTMDGPESKV